MSKPSLNTGKNGEKVSKNKEKALESKTRKRRKRKTKNEKEKKMKQLRQQAINQLKEVHENYKKLNKKKKIPVEDDAKPWGDIMPTNPQWPKMRIICTE